MITRYNSPNRYAAYLSHVMSFDFNRCTDYLIHILFLSAPTLTPYLASAVA